MVNWCKFNRWYLQFAVIGQKKWETQKLLIENIAFPMPVIVFLFELTKIIGNYYSSINESVRRKLRGRKKKRIPNYINVYVKFMMEYDERG